MSKKKKVVPQKQRVNFGNRTRYRREKDDTPVYDRGSAYQFSDGTPADYAPGVDYDYDTPDFNPKD